MNVLVELGKFTRKAMEERVGSDLEEGVRAAVKHYRRRLESGRKPLDFPPFLGFPTGSEPASSVEVSLGAEAEAVVKREAVRQHVTPEQILSHAVLTYLADLDSDGHMLQRIDPPTI